MEQPSDAPVRPRRSTGGPARRRGSARVSRWARGRLLSLPVAGAVRRLGVPEDGFDRAARKIPAAQLADRELAAALGDASLGAWALGPRSIGVVATLVASLRPDLVIELGSGASTVALALASRRLGGAAASTPRIVSLEQDAEQAAVTRERLEAAGLASEAQVIVAPLVEHAVGADRVASYDLTAEFRAAVAGRRAGLIVIDGPAGPPGTRLATLPSLLPIAEPGAVFVLDDGLRDAEMATARRWARLPGVNVRGILMVEKGMLIGTVGEATAAGVRAIETLERTARPRGQGALAWLAARLVRRYARQAASVGADPGLGLAKLGTDYGGWVVPTRLLAPGWRCYCGGVGEDVSFDQRLIADFGCEVWAFDPTPRAITYASSVAEAEPRFHFLPVGLWSTDTTLRFYAPRDPTHVSHSALNLQGTSDWFEARVRSITSLMAELGHPSIDLLKLDVEGAEHVVLRQMLGSGVRPTVVCVEIDRPVAPWRLWSTVRRVRSAGYDLAAVDAWNFTFIRRGAAAGAG